MHKAGPSINVNQITMTRDINDDKEALRQGDNMIFHQSDSINSLISEYRDRISSSLKNLVYTTVTEMEIKLIDSHPVVYRASRISHPEQRHVQGMVQEMIDSNIIRELKTPYACSIVLVKKNWRQTIVL